MFNFSFGGPGGGFPGGMPHSHGGGGGGGRGGRQSAEVNTTKFYELLGTTKEANEADIKKAFRKAAMQHHPDKVLERALTAAGQSTVQRWRCVLTVRCLCAVVPFPRAATPSGSRRSVRRMRC